MSDPDEGSLNKLSLQIGKTNAIGVYGKAVNDARERLAKGDAPKTLFDEIAQEVLNDLRLDVFPRFSNSEFFEKYIRAKSLERIEVTHKDFTMLRVLGRGVSFVAAPPDCIADLRLPMHRGIWGGYRVR